MSNDNHHLSVLRKERLGDWKLAVKMTRLDYPATAEA
jgi:hypothetical protein